MNVPAIGLAGQAAKTTATSSPQTVDYQSFLRLLVAQMKNQDPTSPMEATDYVAQLASFSQVEQSVQINNKLDSILQASTFAQAGGLIGKHITSADGEVAGTIREVRLYSDGILAVLDSGEEIPVRAGVTITDAPPSRTAEDDASA
jgi:flagellar basal-body rod modification protein FlgD